MDLEAISNRILYLLTMRTRHSGANISEACSQAGSGVSGIWATEVIGNIPLKSRMLSFLVFGGLVCGFISVLIFSA